VRVVQGLDARPTAVRDVRARRGPVSGNRPLRCAVLQGKKTGRFEGLSKTLPTFHAAADFLRLICGRSRFRTNAALCVLEQLGHIEVEFKRLAVRNLAGLNAHRDQGVD
jgi:hypothetical protein